MKLKVLDKVQGLLKAVEQQIEKLSDGHEKQQMLTKLYGLYEYIDELRARAEEKN